MKISVNINVRNSEWYWTEEQLLNSKRPDAMARDEWEAFNVGKINKYRYSVQFDYKFEVVSYATNLKTNYELTVYSSNKEIRHTITLNDVTVVEFIGEAETSYVVVSNEIIHQFIAAKPRKDGCLYFYFYLKEDMDCVEVSDNVWISEEQMKKIKDQLGNANKIDVEEDLNINITKSMFGRISRHQPWEDF